MWAVEQKHPAAVKALLEGKADFSTKSGPAGLPRNYMASGLFGRLLRSAPPAEYARLLCRSKIALCPRGYQSAETFRHMESMRAGCVVVSEILPDTRWYRNSPIVTVPDWRTGLEIVRTMLRDDRVLEELQHRTLAWWRDVLSEEATATYVRDRICRLESFPPASSGTFPRS